MNRALSIGQTPMPAAELGRLHDQAEDQVMQEALLDLVPEPFGKAAKRLHRMLEPFRQHRRAVAQYTAMADHRGAQRLSELQEARA